MSSLSKLFALNVMFVIVNLPGPTEAINSLMCQKVCIIIFMPPIQLDLTHNLDKF